MSPLTAIESINDLFILIGKGLTFIFILVATLYSTQYRTQTASNGEKIPPQSTNMLIYMLFGITVSFYVVNVISSFFIEGGAELGSNNYALILMPLVKYILQLTNGEQYDIEITMNT
jgi:hypothetical protein